MQLRDERDAKSNLVVMRDASKVEVVIRLPIERAERIREMIASIARLAYDGEGRSVG